jgi:hypothetical protein
VDWLLAAHQVAPLQYEMGGLWNPVSVRDQMVRGQELVRRAIAAGLISTSRPLVAIGAGAGGMAAAVTADDASVPVVVVERGAQPFARQAGITFRSVHPYVYDWPHDRYTVPDLVAPAALPWREASADNAARQWTAALGGRRLIAFGASVSPPPAGGPAIAIHGSVANVHLTTPSGSGWIRGGMVLSSVGFGTERTAITAALGSTYHGWRFWENDTLSSSNLGAANPPDVIIAGGGDGALQDTMRALLVPSVHDVRDLLAALPAIPHDIRAAVTDAEDTATRAWLWATGGADDCPIFDVLDRRIEAEVQRWWRSAGPDIDRSLQPLWRTDVSTVHLVHSCTHFGRSFALNRFLVFLLEKVLANASHDGPSFLRSSGYHLTSVDGGHVCGTTKPCWGLHRPTYVPKTCTPGRSSPSPFPPTSAVDLIILRGGVAAPVSALAASPVANRRQHLPDRPR